MRSLISVYMVSGAQIRVTRLALSTMLCNSIQPSLLPRAPTLKLGVLSSSRHVACSALLSLPLMSTDLTLNAEQLHEASDHVVMLC